MIYGPSLRYNNGGHVIHHRKQGCVYISGLSVDIHGVRALMKCARVLLMSTTASRGRHFVQGLNALGIPVVSSRMLRVALLGRMNRVMLLRPPPYEELCVLCGV